MRINKQKIIKTLLTTMWICIGTGMVVLLVAAIHKKDLKACRGISIHIVGVNNNFFVDKKDIIKTIADNAGDEPVGLAMKYFNIRLIEQELQKDYWVKKAELFFDNNAILNVNVIEREPQARVFAMNGATFYLDTYIMVLPISDKFSARLPVFTSFPSDIKALNKADSLLLKDIVHLSTEISKDSFSMAMIEQVDITPARTFQMIPKIGNTMIEFGDASDVKSKLERLKLFYRKVIMKAGLNYYSSVNVQFKGQLVAKRRGAEDVLADSLRAKEMMQKIAELAQQRSNDSLSMIQQDDENNSTNESLIMNSFQREDADEPGSVMSEIQPQHVFGAKPPVVIKAVQSGPKPAVPVHEPAKQKPVAKPASKPIAKPVSKPTIKPNNDY